MAMIRVNPGDLIAVTLNDRYYYAVMLDRIRLFGGNWAFAFHRTSGRLLSSAELLGGPQAGFHAFVDFIWAKREGRITIIARKIDIKPYDHVQYLRSAHAIKGTAERWFIYDREFREVKQTSELTEAEKRAPLEQRIDDTIMAERIDRRWTPDKDERI